MDYAPKNFYAARSEVVPSALSVAGCEISLDQKTGQIILPSNDPAEVRAWIKNLTQSLLAMSGAKREFPLKHTLLNGMYMRELFVKKGELIIGKVHKVDCINIVSKGDISVMTETGSARVTAGYTVVTPAGIQKVGYAHEDTIFINVFRTDETDIEKIEAAIAYESYDAIDGVIEQKMEALCQ